MNKEEKDHFKKLVDFIESYKSMIKYLDENERILINNTCILLTERFREKLKTNIIIDEINMLNTDLPEGFGYFAHKHDLDIEWFFDPERRK